MPMMRNYLRTLCRIKTCNFRLLSSLAPNTANQLNDEESNKSYLENAGFDYTTEERSVLDKCHEDIAHVSPYLQPSFNFAGYVNQSETLQKLVQFGVNLYKWEKDLKVPPFILQLDFERDIKNYIWFFKDMGVDPLDIANIITKNPTIFKHDLDDLHTRVNYLKFKKFNLKMITRIVTVNPKWLNLSTQDIDAKLAFFQHTFQLSGHQVRQLATKQPKLITYPLHKIKLNTFVIKEEMGYSPQDTTRLLLETPELFTKDQNFILKSFEYVHHEMKLSLATILEIPRILTCREHRLKERHQFLVKLGKIQFDPKQPKYISPMTVVSGNDSHFATEIAGSSIQAFNAFLKSL